MPLVPPSGCETKCDSTGLVALVDLEFLGFTLPLLVKDNTEECSVYSTMRLIGRNARD